MLLTQSDISFPLLYKSTGLKSEDLDSSLGSAPSKLHDFGQVKVPLLSNERTGSDDL